MATTNKPVACYLKVRTRNNQQEHYETTSRDAGRRAKQLRALGFWVTSCCLGLQVTSMGLVKMTMLTITIPWVDDIEIPDPDRMERI